MTTISGITMNPWDVPKTGDSPQDTQVGGSHYKDMAIQPFTFIMANNLDYCQANVIKYICRHESKNGVEDLDKAIHYIQLLKEYKYGK